MDFIVSKVVVSITALLVVSILTGLLSPNRFTDLDSDLERVLEDLSSTVGRTAMSACEVAITWTVPFLSTGGEVLVTVHQSILSGTSGDQRVRTQPVFELHTWAYDGSMLNTSTIDALDNSSEDVECISGQRLMICNAFVQFENGSRLLLFLSRCS
jgi:hypothetical protein